MIEFTMGSISSVTVVTSFDRSGKVKIKQPGNRERVSVIQGVNACGWAIPPYITMKGKNHLATWYEDNQLPKDWRFNTSENGWTTNEIDLDWIKHFDMHTKARTVGIYRLVLDGHESHQSTEFEIYCKDNNIISLCIPPHSSHLLQPLEVGCFNPLKKAYSKEIESMIRNNITHISKEDFIPTFQAAYQASITENNILRGFEEAGLNPLNPEAMFSKLNIRLKTPSTPNSRPGTAGSWTSKTPKTIIEATAQSNLVKNQIMNHPDSSPTKIYHAIDQFAKGSLALMHELALLRAQVRGLQAANDILGKRRRAKKTRLRKGGSLSVQEVQDLKDEIEVGGQVDEETRGNRGHTQRKEIHGRRCGNCGKTGHNIRTCQEDEEMSEESD
jgi:hypothetical protein